MRRLLMTTDCVTGVWTYSLDLARGLAAYGVETTLAILGPAPDAAQEEEARSVPGLQFLPTGLPLPSKAANEDEIEQTSIAVARFANIIDADIVHLNSPILAAHGHFHAPVVAVCHSCPTTWWQAVHHDEPMPEDDLWRADLIRRGYEAADVLVASTASFAAVTQQTYGLARAPLVVRNGRRMMRTGQGPHPVNAFAITVGRSCDEGKNLATLNRAASRLAVPVMAAGPLAAGVEGLDRTASVVAANDLGHLWTLGAMPEPELARWLEAAPVFVSCARYAPFGLSVIEAAQSGCALVLSDIPSFRELWGDAAEFVPANDDRAVAAAVESLLADKDRCEERAAAAMHRAEDYSIEATAAAMMAIYRSLEEAMLRARLSRDAVA